MTKHSNRPCTAVSNRGREKKSLLSTDLGLFKGLSRRPRATRGPGGGLASTGGKTGAPLDFSFFFDVFSFLSFSILVGVVGPVVSWGFPAWGAFSFSLSPGASGVELVGLDLEAGEEMSTCTQHYESGHNVGRWTKSQTLRTKSWKQAEMQMTTQTQWCLERLSKYKGNTTLIWVVTFQLPQVWFKPTTLVMVLPTELLRQLN